MFATAFADVSIYQLLLVAGVALFASVLGGVAGYGTGAHFRRVREAHGPLRAAILPIGAYEPRWFMLDQHMNPEDAVKALGDCGAEMAFAHHHGTFQLTDEAIDAPVQALGVALEAAKVPREKFAVLKPGQVMEI